MRKSALSTAALLTLLTATPAAAQQRMPQGAYMGSADVTSGVVTAAQVTATMPGVPNQINVLTGFEMTSNNATAGCYQINLTGILATPIPYFYCVPGGNAEPAPVISEFTNPLIASGPNVPIVMQTVGALGAGTSGVITLHGYRIQ